MRLCIVGCGLIGQKRAAHAGNHEVVAAVDPAIDRAKKIKEQFPDAVVLEKWEDALKLSHIDAALIATTPNRLAEITLAFVSAGMHVLVDKPAARCAAELKPILDHPNLSKVKVRVGFNHRYHPAMLKAKEIVDAGELGPLMFLRGRYGHGGRLGYEKEWRADKQIGGGGELLDQGMHLIDLSRMFLGDFAHVDGYVDTYFWKMPVEDNGFLALRTVKNQMAWLHVSWTEWKNMFCLEIYGRDGKLQIDGLGGSYGTEKLTFYKMLPEMGPPQTQTWEFPEPDNSWALELDEFAADIGQDRQPNPGIKDAYEALSVVDRIYEQSAKNPVGSNKQ